MVRSVLIDASCQQYADEKMLKRAPAEVGVFYHFVLLLAVACGLTMDHNVGRHHYRSSNAFKRYRTSVCDHT
jgi:hypothetical protein